ncbi:MAG: hypothetical protein ABSE92_04795 [Terriglobales bacterium]
MASPWPIADALAVLLDPMHIVANIHDAYEHPYFKQRSYSLLMAGPSGSGDIGGIVVHPAQGAKTLTILLRMRVSVRGWLSASFIHSKS